MARGVDTMVYYPVPQDKLPVYEELPSSNPVSDLMATQVLSLPLWPSISRETQELVASELLTLVG